MVKLKKLHLERFMNIKELDLEFRDKEMIIISGNNGSGKSAAMAAIAVALIEYRKGDSYKDFIMKGEKSSIINLEATYRDEPIKIEIIISSGIYDAALERSITYRDVVYVNSECKTLLQRLEVNYLKHTMFLFQRDNSIVDLTPGERSQLLRKLFKFEFEDQVIGLKDQIDTIRNNNLEASIRLEELNKIHEDPLDMERVLDKIKLKILLENKSDIKKEIAEYSQYDEDTYNTLLGQLDTLETKLSKIKNEKTSAKKQVDEALENIKSLASGQKALVDEIDTLTESTKEKPEVEKIVEEFRNQITQINSTIVHLKERLEERKGHLKIHELGTCYACGQKIDDLVAIDALKKVIDELKEELFEKEELQRAEVKAYAWKVADLEKLEASDKLLSQHTGNLKDTKVRLEAERQAHIIHSNSFEEKREAFEEVETQVKAKSLELEPFKDLKGILEKKAEAVNLLEEITSTENLHNSNKAINEERKRQNRELKKRTSSRNKQKEAYASEITSGIENLEILKHSVAIFETDLPNFIILQTCTKIELYMNKIIQKVFPYMTVKLKPVRTGVEFHYTLDDSEEGEWLSVKMASGAQGSILSLAWRVALARLYGVSTLLLDEVDADSTSDNSRIIYEFISSLDIFDQIVLISHRVEAIEAVNELADNLTCYKVKRGHFEKIDPSNLIF